MKSPMMIVPTAVTERDQYVARRREATRSSRATMGRNVMEEKYSFLSSD